MPTNEQRATGPVLICGWDNQNEIPVRIPVNADGSQIEGMGIPVHDARVLVWDAGVLTAIQYYVGGTSGTLVATKTLTYDAGKLVSVVVT